MTKIYRNDQIKFAINVVAERESRSLSMQNKPILYSSSGDFPAYDDEMYDLMTNDQLRNDLYENEIKRQVAGKVVLDIGTGSHANWALCAAQCGAKKVYAIESMQEAYTKAGLEVASSEFAEIITLFHGLSTKVELPEKVDICISEILGCPVSSEAVVTVLNDAKQRFLKANAKFIIDRCVTKIAACSLGSTFKKKLGICETDIKYLNRIFSITGRPFDVRVLIDNLPRNWIVSSAAVMEDIEFNKGLPTTTNSEISICVLKDASIDGLVCWIKLFGSSKTGKVLDTLENRTNWLPVFFPVFYPGQTVKKGDILNFSADTFLKSGEINPDYLFRGNILRNSKIIAEFEFTSAYISEKFRGDAFYKALFPDY